MVAAAHSSFPELRAAQNPAYRLIRYFSKTRRKLIGPRAVTVRGIMGRTESTRATTHHNGSNPNGTRREFVAVDVITPAVGEGSSKRSSTPLDDKNRLVVDTIFF